MATTWYARWIYEQGSEAYRYHCATYGHPSKFGYKDICKLFKASKFDQAQADRLARALQEDRRPVRGAGRGAPRQFRHVGFEVPAALEFRGHVGQGRGGDVAEGRGQSGAASGRGRALCPHLPLAAGLAQANRSGPLAGVPYDGQDPQSADLYGVKWKHDSIYPDFWYEQRSDVGPPAFEKNFEDRLVNLMDKYHPDLYYTDGGIPFKQAGLNVLAPFLQ